MTAEPTGGTPEPQATFPADSAADADVNRAVPATEAAATAVVRAEGSGLELVRFLYADHGGIIRGKAAARQFLAERISSGIGHTVAMMAMSMLDQLQPVEGMGPVGEIRLVPDPATLVPLPYSPGAGAMLADQVGADGRPWDGCARTFLKQATTRLAGGGLRDVGGVRAGVHAGAAGG